MCEWDRVFPQFGLKSHKGYSTEEHWKALEKYGPTSMHRFSFWPVRDHCPHSFWAGYPKQAELFTPEELGEELAQEAAACQ
jgi:ribonuclease HII